MFKKQGGFSRPLEPFAGFTVMEILVILTVIALALVLILNFAMGARKKARDVARLNNVEAIGKALNLYLTGSSEGYPHSEGECLSDSSSVGSSLRSLNVINNMPLDPRWPDTLPAPNPEEDYDGFCFYYTSLEYDYFTINYFLETDEYSGKSGAQKINP